MLENEVKRKTSFTKNSHKINSPNRFQVDFGYAVESNILLKSYNN